uniref:Uncharacterized protein n=1 Tax=Oryza punctata TaxID=4537 RepID=A0A0E0MIT6_ORYPU
MATGRGGAGWGGAGVGWLRTAPALTKEMGTYILSYKDMSRSGDPDADIIARVLWEIGYLGCICLNQNKSSLSAYYYYKDMPRLGDPDADLYIGVDNSDWYDLLVGGILMTWNAMYLILDKIDSPNARSWTTSSLVVSASGFPYPFPSPLSKTLANPSSSCTRRSHLLAASISRAESPVPLLRRRRRDVSAAYGDDDMDDDFGDFDLDDGDGVGDDEDLDNEQDYDVDYDRLLAPVKAPPRPLSREGEEEEGDIAMVAAQSFISTQDSASDTVVDYSVNEDEFHKIRLLHCDFFIRKVPDPDDDVFDFREMYVTPPDTDIYSIPRVLAPMPQKDEYLQAPICRQETAATSSLVVSASGFPYPFPSPLSKTLANPSSSCTRRSHLLAASISRAESPVPLLRRRRRDVSAAYGDDDMDDDFGDFDLDDGDGVGDDEDLDNEQDYDVDYDRLLAPVKAPPRPLSREGEEEEGDIAMVAAQSFISTQDSASDTVVDYSVNEDEFHKIRLLHCDFFIRKVPDPDDDVFDFREMYVTPPDTDIYSIPRVLAPMPQKYVRCTKKNFGRYHVSEPPVEHLRDPLYKTEREIMKVFLTKHYRNRRCNDPDFFLDFEEIYVIDSTTRSITRARVVVSVPEGKKRDRRNDLLLIRDGGESFRIIDKTKRDDATTVIQREEWAKSRQDVEKHFRKLRDFDYSNCALTSLATVSRNDPFWTPESLVPWSNRMAPEMLV